MRVGVRRVPEAVLLASILLAACGASGAGGGTNGSRDGSAGVERDGGSRGIDAIPLDAEPVDLGSPAADAGPSAADSGASGDAGEPPTGDAGASLDVGTEAGGPQPVVFVHGINGSSAEFEVMKGRLVADGWPVDQLYAIDFPDPSWGCNVDNAEVIRATIAAVRAETGAAKVDLVAHSMGTISSKQYMKHLGGAAEVSTFVTLGGLHHGNRLACLNPLPVCVWQELCPSNELLTELNADPAAPGPARWVSICSRSDETADLETCHFEPAENVEVDGVDHAGANGLLEHPDVYPELRRVLEYPAP